MSGGEAGTLFYLIAAIAANVPLGYMGSRQKLLSFGWFYYSLLPLPVIFYLQAKSLLETGSIVLVMMSVVIGQLLGGLMKVLTTRKSTDNGYGV